MTTTLVHVDVLEALVECPDTRAGYYCPGHQQRTCFDRATWRVKSADGHGQNYACDVHFSVIQERMGPGSVWTPL